MPNRSGSGIDGEWGDVEVKSVTNSRMACTIDIGVLIRREVHVQMKDVFASGVTSLFYFASERLRDSRSSRNPMN